MLLLLTIRRYYCSFIEQLIAEIKFELVIKLNKIHSFDEIKLILFKVGS